MVARVLGNWGVVKKGKLYRSGQYFPFSYIPWLWARPKTVMNVATSPATDWEDRFERWLCDKLGLEYMTWPTLAPGELMRSAYSSFKAAKGSVLIHCEGGKDRTGALVSLIQRAEYGERFERIIDDWFVHRPPYSELLEKAIEFEKWLEDS